MENTFEEFLGALLAFESGWDRERYDTGEIQDGQLDQWANGTVQYLFPQYSSWSDLTADEWEMMAYRSLNSFGFVGYQFGEALLIDLGYYDDDLYYGNGAATNTWDGTWTGKNGVGSLEDFMTKGAQDVAIREAFGHNLGIINEGLSAAGRSLDEFIGTTIDYVTEGGTTPVTVTLTGILASAHLRGAPAVVDLFLTGGLSNDEFGTSTLQYMQQFGGFDAPQSDELISYFQDRLTGEEGLGLGNEPTTGNVDTGTAGVDAGSADVVIDWNWGTDTVETDFNPATDTIFIGWFNAGHIEIYELDGNAVFSIPSNNQTTTLQGITLADLSHENFTIMDDTAAAEILAVIGQAAGGNTGDDSDDGSNTDDDGQPDTGTGGDTDGNSGGDTGGDSGINPGGDAATGTPIIAAYFPEWGIYERDHNMTDVQAQNITNLIYSFVNVNSAFEIELHDPWAATGKTFSAQDSIDGVADTWDQPVAGHFNQLAELKEANPHLTTQLGIGGWTLSGNFSDMAATSEGRTTFINSVVDFLRENTMFDGIDFDWEYPGGGGLSTNSVRPEDGANFTLLAAETRAALDQLESETGRSFTISAALPAGHDKIANLDIPGLAANLDYMNIMTYDFYGAWQNTTGHLAGMYDLTGANYDVTTAIDLYLEAGVDPSKIVLGLPAFTRGWQGVSVDNPIDAWNGPSGGGAPGTYPGSEPAYYEYKDLLAELQASHSDWGLYYDDDAQAAFLYNPTQGIFSSFETPSTIALKSEWAQSLGLGGVMFWDTSGDSNGPESLITAAYNSWFEGMSFDEIAEASSLEFDEVFGGDGVVAPIAETDTAPSDLPDGPGAGDDNTGGETGGSDASDGESDNDGEAENGNSGGDQVSPSSVRVVLDAVWAGALSATLSFSTQEDMDGWTLSFEYAGDIQNIQGATIISHEGNVYTVQPTGDNAEVGAGETASFSFYAVGSSTEITPVGLDTDDDFLNDMPGDDAGDDTGDDTVGDTGGEPDSDETGNNQVIPSSVQVSLDSVWAGALSATLSFTAQESLAGWTLSFDYDGDIQTISGASIVSRDGNVYTVQPTGENANADAGEVVSFNFYGVGSSTEITPMTLDSDSDANDGMDHGGNGSADDGADDDGDHSNDNGMDHGGVGHGDHDFIDINHYGSHHDSSDHTTHDELEGGRTAITTEAVIAYNALRDFLGLQSTDIQTIGEWAFANDLTNNDTAFDMDVYGVGLFYAMQGAKAGWIADEHYDPQILADVQRTARLSTVEETMAIVDQYDHSGFAEYLVDNGLVEHFVNTLKMEPHYGGWMHSRTHGDLIFPDSGGATAHDVNHLTILNDSQTSPFMNDTFEWPQWPALEVEDEVVINYFQSMVTLTDPLGEGIAPGTGDDQVDQAMDMGDNVASGDGDGSDDGGTSPAIHVGGGETVSIDWNWAAQEVISDFVASEDEIDFGSMGADNIGITEVGDDLYIEVLNNGGQTYVFENIQAEDLTLANLSVPYWNEDVLDEVVEQLATLGNYDIL